LKETEHPRVLLCILCIYTFWGWVYEIHLKHWNLLNIKIEVTLQFGMESTIGSLQIYRRKGYLHSW